MPMHFREAFISYIISLLWERSSRDIFGPTVLRSITHERIHLMFRVPVDLERLLTIFVAPVTPKGEVSPGISGIRWRADKSRADIKIEKSRWKPESRMKVSRDDTFKSIAIKIFNIKTFNMHLYEQSTFLFRGKTYREYLSSRDTSLIKNFQRKLEF